MPFRSLPSRRHLGFSALGVGLLTALWAHGRYSTRRAERRHPPEGRFVPVDDGCLHVVERGQGRPLVLIHGAAYQHGDILDSPLGDRMVARYRAISFDRPGHGYSDSFPFHMAPQHQAELLRAAVRRMGIERPILVGHSLGGAVALAWALAHPEEVAGVVALAPQAFAQASLGTIGFGAISTFLAEPLTSVTLGPPIGRLLMYGLVRQAFAPQKVPDAFWRNAPLGLTTRPRQIRANGIELLADPPAMLLLQRRWGDLKVPLSILAGTGDRVLPFQAHAERLADVAPGARLRALPGLGHMFHHFAPEAVMQEIARIAALADAPPLRRSGRFGYSAPVVGAGMP